MAPLRAGDRYLKFDKGFWLETRLNVWEVMHRISIKTGRALKRQRCTILFRNLTKLARFVCLHFFVNPLRTK